MGGEQWVEGTGERRHGERGKRGDWESLNCSGRIDDGTI